MFLVTCQNFFFQFSSVTFWIPVLLTIKNLQQLTIILVKVSLKSFFHWKPVILVEMCSEALKNQVGGEVHVAAVRTWTCHYPICIGLQKEIVHTLSLIPVRVG